MLIIKALFVVSACGLLAMIAVVAYDIYLAIELEKLNRRACVIAPSRRAVLVSGGTVEAFAADRGAGRRQDR